jgi:hypothetical protein
VVAGTDKEGPGLAVPDGGDALDVLGVAAGVAGAGAGFSPPEDEQPTRSSNRAAAAAVPRTCMAQSDPTGVGALV